MDLPKLGARLRDGLGPRRRPPARSNPPTLRCSPSACGTASCAGSCGRDSSTTTTCSPGGTAAFPSIRASASRWSIATCQATFEASSICSDTAPAPPSRSSGSHGPLAATAAPTASFTHSHVTSAASGSAQAAGARPPDPDSMASSTSRRLSFSTAWQTSCRRHETTAIATTVFSPPITRSSPPSPRWRSAISAHGPTPQRLSRWERARVREAGTTNSAFPTTPRESRGPSSSRASPKTSRSRRLGVRRPRGASRCSSMATATQTSPADVPVFDIRSL